MSNKKVLDTTFPLWNGLQEDRVWFARRERLFAVQFKNHK